MTHLQLVVIAGPSKGSVIDLDEGELSIGRLASNHVFIPDPSVSRHQCVIIREGAQVTLRDLDSTHGSFVGEVPVKERVLEHGDQIRLGTSLMLFLDRGRDERADMTSRIEDQPITTGTTIELRPQDATYLRADVGSLATGAAATIAVRRTAHLKVLVNLGSALMALREPEQVQRKLLRFVVD